MSEILLFRTGNGYPTVPCISFEEQIFCLVFLKFGYISPIITISIHISKPECKIISDFSRILSFYQDFYTTLS